MKSKLYRAAIQKIPPYIPGKPIEEVERELGIGGVVKMASNENPLGPSKEVRQVIQQSLDKLAYYPDASNFYLRDAIAQEWEVPVENLLIGNGLDDVFRILAETLLNPEDEVIIPQPSFSMYQSVTLLMGAKPVLVKGKQGLGNDLTAMAKAVTDRTKIIFICNPNNPTGTIVKTDELVRFLDSLPPQILVGLDEAYADFNDDPDFPYGIKLFKNGAKNIIVFRTFSKIYGIAGLRLGYAIGPAELMGQANKIRDPFNVNLLAQKAGIAALGSKKHVELSRKLVFEGRRQFYQELDEMKLEYLPTQANFILINLGRDSKEIYQRLLENGVIVRPTHSFGLPNYIRVTFGTAEQNDRFFRVFRDVWKKL